MEVVLPPRGFIYKKYTTAKGEAGLSSKSYKTK